MALADWIKVTRVQTAAVTMLALWGGHITVAPLTIRSTLYLGLLGLLVHIWGFTMNEVEDASYDEQHSNKSSHPISIGKISGVKANMLAWGSLVAFSLIHIIDSPLIFELNIINLYESESYALLMLTGGYLYNKKSKEQWYSPAYLSVWAFSLVMLGAYHAGLPNTATVILALVLSIQIFVQVAEGDMKDIQGPENTFIEKLGVKYQDSLYIPSRSIYIIKIIKYVEGMLLLILASYAIINLNSYILMSVWLFIICAVIAIAAFAVFMLTSTLWLNDNFDRNQIKKLASVHEITSIIFIGTCLMPYNLIGGILVALAPPTWYVLVNKMLYANPLSPDI